MNTKSENMLRQILVEADKRNTPPSVEAYHRIDGPGSSLDLPEFQEAFWRMPSLPKDFEDDPALAWSNGLPRTVGITINSGTRVSAHPYLEDQIAVASRDYKFDVSAKPGEVLPIRENWLLKIMEIFALKGVKFVLRNLNPNTCSSGLGGSATATTAVCILANELAGRLLNAPQIVALASRIEQHLGVSITGTQEQSNVVYGGVTDYLWLPWGLPRTMSSLREDAGFGTSFRREIVACEDYGDLEKRLCIFHSGKTRSSTDVNAAWIEALSSDWGYGLHKKAPGLSYQYCEGLRLRDWKAVMDSIDAYRTMRTELCPAYMDGAVQIQDVAEVFGCASFPLGAGGGGAALIFGLTPDSVQATRNELANQGYAEIPVRIRQKGHERLNLQQVGAMWNACETDENLSQTTIEKELCV